MDLYAPYNNTNENASPLIPISQLDVIRGSGQFNPAPLYPQTTDNGNAYVNAASKNPYAETLSKTNETNGDLYQTPAGAIEYKESWSKNTNYDIKPVTSDNYEYYDEYQRWALNNIRLTDPYLLPYLFSKINVKYLQDSVVKYVKQYRDITINTKQDENALLNTMVSAYNLYRESKGVYLTEKCANDAQNDPATKFSSILANINKAIIEEYVKKVLSGIDMYNYYMHDISHLPIPLSNPTMISNKGSNSLGFRGYFENNHEFTQAIDSFNIRDINPGKINSTNFGN